MNIPPLEAFVLESSDPVAELESELEKKYPRLTLSLWRRNRSDGWYLHVQTIALKRGDQGRGTGSSVMEDICAFADSHRIMVALTPGVQDPNWGTTSRSRLVAFYKRFGFVENKGRRADLSLSEGMIRPAR